MAAAAARSTGISPRERQVRMSRDGLLGTLAEVARMVHTKQASAGETLAAVLGLVCRELEIKRAAVGVLDVGRHVLVIDVARDLSLQERARMRYSASAGVLGGVLGGGAPVALAIDGEESWSPGSERGDVGPEHTERALLCAAAMDAGHVHGVIVGELPACAPALRASALQAFSTVASLIVPLLAERYAELEALEATLSAASPRAPIALGDDFAALETCAGMRDVVRLMRQVAPSDASVFIRGEAGVGKELIARTLHRLSTNSDGAFVGIRCASLGEGSIASEIRAERMRVGGDGGARMSLFLDDVGELSSVAQAQLVRWLSAEGDRARVLCSTREDLSAAVQEGRFRPDLYYRLQVFPIDIAPLRERRSDIPTLAQHFLRKQAELHGRNMQRISDAALSLLLDYTWPGNLRELENAMSRAVLLSHYGIVRQHHLPPALQPVAPPPTHELGFEALMDAHERKLIGAALTRARGSRNEAARLLGTSLSALSHRIRRLGGADPMESES